MPCLKACRQARGSLLLRRAKGRGSVAVGTDILFQDGVTTCQIASGRRVSFDGEDFSLTALTQKLLDTDRPLQPSPYWTYQGKRLIDIYDETYDTL